jgi:hypothetical protein
MVLILNSIEERLIPNKNIFKDVNGYPKIYKYIEKFKEYAMDILTVTK